VAGNWIGQNDEEPHDLCPSQNIIWAIKPSEDEMGDSCITHRKRLEMYTIYSLQNINGRDHSEDVSADGG
jgi:hypothetical protein